VVRSDCIQLEKKEVKLVFEGKLFVAFGERDGVPGPVMTEVLKAAGLNVIYQITECFV
jgi:glycine/sarcosine/betaine reductase complex component A